MNNLHGIIYQDDAPVCKCGAALKDEGYQTIAVLGYRKKLWTCTSGGSTFAGKREPLADALVAAEAAFDTTRMDGDMLSRKGLAVIDPVPSNGAWQRGANLAA